METERILIVADDSPCSIHAVKYGLKLAHKLKAKVGLAGVIDEALAMGNPDAGIFPEQAAFEMKSQMEKFLQQLIKDFGKGIDAELFAPEGELKETILDLAKEWEATMIVTGTHSRKGLNRLLMGSLAESILRDAHVPVVVVPMEKE